MTTWKCPICALETLPYGTNCPQFPTCPNAAKAHVTGRYYLQLEAEKQAKNRERLAAEKDSENGT